MVRKLFIAMLLVSALSSVCDAQVITYPPVDARKRATATGTKPTMKEGQRLELIGYTTANDGFYSLVEYYPASALTVDNVFVFAPKSGQPGRLVAIDRSLADLEYAGLEEDEDITTLLTNVAANFTGNVFRIRMPRTLTNLTCDYVIFPVGLERFEVFAGGPCTITQVGTPTGPTGYKSVMWRIPYPDRVNIERGVSFVGDVDTAHVTNNARGLVFIETNSKAANGGTIDCHAHFLNTSAAGFGIATNETYAYDSISVSGNYINAGLSLNTDVNHVKIDALLTDPDGYAWSDTVEVGKSRGLQLGRVQKSMNVNCDSQFGDCSGFIFACGDDVTGTVNWRSYRGGYESDGTVLTGSGGGGVIIKTDTLGDMTNVNFNISEKGNHPDTDGIWAEATPGPTINNTFVVDSDVATVQLLLTDNSDGGDTYINYGNNLFDSKAYQVNSGLASIVRDCSIDLLRLVRSGPSSTIYSLACCYDRVTINKSLFVQHGTQSDFKNCTFPKTITWSGSGLSTIMNFRDCQFFPGTTLAPSVLSDLRLGFAGTVSGLSLANIPTQSLPYLRFDGHAHPRLDRVTFPVTANSFSIQDRQFETINRPVGWKTNGPVEMVYYAAGIVGTQPDPMNQIRNVDRTSAMGGIVWPSITAGTANGAALWDIGVDEGTIEGQLRFILGGTPRAGFIARSPHDNTVIYAYLDQTSSKVRVRLGNISSGTLDTSVTDHTFTNGTTYKLKLKIDNTNYQVWLNDVSVIGPTAHGDASGASETKWGLKYINEVSDVTGPEWIWWEVRPNDADAAVETERRTL